MDTEPLVRALVSVMMLLENSDASEVDPDVAVRGMENLSHELLKLNSADRSEFVSIVTKIAESERQPSVANFVRSLPFMLGLVP